MSEDISKENHKKLMFCLRHKQAYLLDESGKELPYPSVAAAWSAYSDHLKQFRKLGDVPQHKALRSIAFKSSPSLSAVQL